MNGGEQTDGGVRETMMERKSMEERERGELMKEIQD